MKTFIRFIMVLAMATTALPALAGNLDAPGAPAATVSFNQEPRRNKIKKFVEWVEEQGG